MFHLHPIIFEVSKWSERNNVPLKKYPRNIYFGFFGRVYTNQGILVGWIFRRRRVRLAKKEGIINLLLGSSTMGYGKLGVMGYKELLGSKTLGNDAWWVKIAAAGKALLRGDLPYLIFLCTLVYETASIFLF